jgi:urease accessory protein
MAALVAALVFPMMAQAHPGHDEVQGVAAGMLHPLAGMDHLAAMLAVGLWGAQMGGRARWILPLSFVVMMGVGAALGMAGVQLPMVEATVLASVLVLGLMLALAARTPLVVGGVLTAVFALAHGHSHGAEVASQGSALGYGVGFMAMTLGLHLAGLGAGELALRIRREGALRMVGGLIVGAGAWMALG